ncbi:3-isopropylmalate dehydratase large subunit [Rhodococcus sp. IEGM 1307]|uniref:3-isopropylmalate dehydratase large subunit n=1 Tax=Rhodococcus sp. IEGM 1307 TaxID=3047091 RepID=UPI0024B68C83|nr:3-isopropylmalate dehydratase large subunit [Rhodococcus sp. IEGM 1307]MDI9979577.1 3-isopropylmalate dehydratase large subunit [Rhodococcus sp. IEGM 1307]
MARNIIDKIWDSHVLTQSPDGESDLFYIDFHLLHEASSPQAFEGLRIAGRTVRRPDLSLATEDHVVSTRLNLLGSGDDNPVAREMVSALRKNCAEFGIALHSLGSADQGIVHVVGPQLGITQPGMTIVCGDSHTSTHGAFGALAFGIGTSQVEHVLASQTLWMTRPKTMAVTFTGKLPRGTTAKDLVLHLIAEIGTGGAQGFVIEYRGEPVRDLSMESRMTLCNMSIESGARAGLIAPDRTTYDYLRGRPYAPVGDDWTESKHNWDQLLTDGDATFDREITLDVADLEPFVTWGINPGQALPVSSSVPDPVGESDARRREQITRALDYMDLTPGTPLRDVAVDAVFIGSCTNGRLDDLRAAAEILQGRRIPEHVTTVVVPGSAEVKRRAESEGLDVIFEAAGAQWRSPGCSLCVAMNDDFLEPGTRCASTSNRNFEGRQGSGVRTHLVSPTTAAATAVLGHLASANDL